MSHSTRPLTPRDAGQLLTLQRAAYASEAQIYRAPFLPALTQTLDELCDELAGPALGVHAEGRLIGAVRWTVDVDTVRFGRLIVAPDMQGKGICTALLRSAEEASGASRFELFTGHLSEANIRLYVREGYIRTRQVALQPGSSWSSCKSRPARACLPCFGSRQCGLVGSDSRLRMFTGEQWEPVAPFLLSNEGRRGHPFGNSRRVAEDVAYRYRDPVA